MNLRLDANETANVFYHRVKYYHHNHDFEIPAATKAQQAYKDGLETRIRESFIEDLPSELLSKMAAENVSTITNPDLVTASLQAQALLPASASTPSASTAPTVGAISS